MERVDIHHLTAIPAQIRANQPLDHVHSKHFNDGFR